MHSYICSELSLFPTEESFFLVHCKLIFQNDLFYLCVSVSVCMCWSDPNVYFQDESSPLRGKPYSAPGGLGANDEDSPGSRAGAEADAAEAAEEVEYTIAAFGKDYRLNFVRNRKLLGPGFKVLTRYEYYSSLREQHSTCMYLKASLLLIIYLNRPCTLHKRHVRSGLLPSVRHRGSHNSDKLQGSRIPTGFLTRLRSFRQQKRTIIVIKELTKPWRKF